MYFESNWSHKKGETKKKRLGDWAKANKHTVWEQAAQSMSPCSTLNTISKNLFGEDRSKQAINSTCRQVCSIGQICSRSCSFQLWIELLPVPLCGPVFIERSHNMVRPSWLDKRSRSRSQRRDRCRNRPDNRSYPTPVQSRFSWVTHIIGRPIPVESYMQCARIIVPMKSTDILHLSTTQIHTYKIYD